MQTTISAEAHNSTGADVQDEMTRVNAGSSVLYTAVFANDVAGSDCHLLTYLHYLR